MYLNQRVVIAYELFLCAENGSVVDIITLTLLRGKANVQYSHFDGVFEFALGGQICSDIMNVSRVESSQRISNPLRSVANAEQRSLNQSQLSLRTLPTLPATYRERGRVLRGLTPIEFCVCAKPYISKKYFTPATPQYPSHGVVKRRGGRCHEHINTR